MNKVLLTLVVAFFASPLFAQKLEISVQAYSDRFHNTGMSATSESVLVQSDAQNTSNYTTNPYGNKYGFSYGAAVQGQWVSKSGFIAGVQTGFERLTSEVGINGVTPYYNYYFFSNANFATNPPPTATGTVYLRTDFINIAPYVGYRLKLKNLSLDLLPGVDLGLALKTKEDGKALTTSSQTEYDDTHVYHVKPPTDVRLRLGLAFSFNRYGIIASYAHGLTNYQKYMDNDSNTYNSKSELWRLGLSYRIF